MLPYCTEYMCQAQRSKTNPRTGWFQWNSQHELLAQTSQYFSFISWKVQWDTSNTGRVMAKENPQEKIKSWGGGGGRHSGNSLSAKSGIIILDKACTTWTAGLIKNKWHAQINHLHCNWSYLVTSLMLPTPAWSCALACAILPNVGDRN